MDTFFNSRWFLVAKAALFSAVVFLVQQDAEAEAQKAAGLPVTAIDLPASVTPALAVIYGMLQTGQRKS